MKRLLAVALLGAVVASVTGCDLSTPAAVVNGNTISQSQLDTAISAVSDNPTAQCAASVLTSAGGGTLPTIRGAGDSTVTTQFAAFELTGLVQQAIETNALARRHAHVTPSDVAAARQDYEAQVSAASSQYGSPCNLTGSNLVDRLPAQFVTQQAQALALQERLEEVTGRVDVSTAALRSYYDTHHALVTQECLNLIVANDQASAQAIHDQIAAGTTFAAASQGSGTSPNSPPSGVGPCLYPSAVTGELGQATAGILASLADGQLAAPQGIPVADQVTGSTSTVWVVLGMRQHQLVPFSDVEGGLRRLLLQQGQSGLTSTLTRAAVGVSVDLDPRYGTWSARRGVVTPVPPAASLLLNPSVDQSASGASALGSSVGAPSGG